MRNRNALGSIRRVVTVGGVALCAMVAMATAAVAHVPVLLDETDKNPLVAPLAVDGTDAVNFFGVLPRRHTVRSAQFTMQAGQQVNIALVIPDLAPENTLADNQLPTVYLWAPDGSITTLTANTRTALTAGGLNLLRLLTYTAPASAGTYSVLVSGPKPARFIVSVGQDQEGGVFDGIERGTVATQAQIQNWYATAP